MKIFFDMDGTLSEFQSVGPDIWSSPGYARTLSPLENVVEAVKCMLETPDFFGNPVEVYICSAVVSMDFAVADKKAWLKDMEIDIPEQNLIFVPYGQSKAEAIKAAGIETSAEDLFIDDYTKNLIEIHRAEGLKITPIKLLNGINDTNKSWDGPRVSAFSCPSDIITTLYGISSVNKILSAA